MGARTPIDTNEKMPIQSGPKITSVYTKRKIQIQSTPKPTPVDAKQKSRCSLEEKHTTWLPSGTKLPAPPSICTTGNQNKHTERRITDTA